MSDPVEDVMLDLLAKAPAGKSVSPEDVARAVAFLADPERSGFINGAALSVDGGWAVDGSWQSLRLDSRGR